MSETTIDEQVENQEPEAQAKPQGEAEPEASETGQEEPQGAPAVDWKAEARKWEARAKDNKAKADEAEERAIKTEAELEKARLVTRIAQETGVPAGLIHGESAEELEASAKAAAEWARVPRARLPFRQRWERHRADGHPRVHRRNQRPDCEDPRPGGERRPIPIARRQHART